MEKIISSLAGVSGHTYDTIYQLFFTTERIIAAIIRHPLDIPYQYPSIWQSVFLGSGSTRRRERSEQEKIIQTRCAAFEGLTPDELCTTHPRNFEIYYHTIDSIEIKRKFFQWQLRFHISSPSESRKIIGFGLAKKQLPEARQLLKSVLLPKIK